MWVSGQFLLVLATGCVLDHVHSIPLPNNTGLLSSSLEGSLSQCGKSNRKNSHGLSIVGGKDAKLGNWPWMVALTVRMNPFQVGSCGGSLISKEWILTASHCVLRDGTHRAYNPSQFTIRLGDLNLDDEVNDGASPIEVPADKIVFHPDFSWTTGQNDIALIHLEHPVEFTENIRPICVLSGEEYRGSKIYNGKTAFIVGWGLVKSTSERISSMLQESSEPVVDQEECAHKYSSLDLGIEITEKQICAGKPGTGICHGDSGGPLIFFNETEDSYYVGGIVSASIECGVGKYPDIFTKVAQFTSWMNEITGEDF